MNDFETFKARILQAIESQKRLWEDIYNSLSFDYGKAFEEYASGHGKEPSDLTEDEKKQAVIEAVLKECDD